MVKCDKISICDATVIGYHVHSVEPWHFLWPWVILCVCLCV